MKKNKKKISPAAVGQAVEMYKKFLRACAAVGKREEELSDFVETLSKEEFKKYMEALNKLLE